MLRFTEAEFLAYTQAGMRGAPPAHQNDATPAPGVSIQAYRGEAQGSRIGIDEAARIQGRGVVSKYRAVKTTVDGITFASKAEAKRYGELKLMEAAEQIHDLKLQPVFVLAPSVRINERKRPALRYVADFSYWTKSSVVPIVEDVKGMLTPVYRIKRHLMKSVLGIDIVEITK